jgi:hypothetical protein
LPSPCWLILNNTMGWSEASHERMFPNLDANSRVVWRRIGEGALAETRRASSVDEVEECRLIGGSGSDERPAAPLVDEGGSEAAANPKTKGALSDAGPPKAVAWLNSSAVSLLAATSGGGGPTPAACDTLRRVKSLPVSTIMRTKACLN